MSSKLMAKGLLSWVPGLHRVFIKHGSGTASASYCYGVWLKHLTLLWASGMRRIPERVVELGPGASVGTGVAALLSGAQRYRGIDAVDFTSSKDTVEVFYGLHALFRNRAPGPSRGFPRVEEFLDAARFPSHILPPQQLDSALQPARVSLIEQAVLRLAHSGGDPRLGYQTGAQPDTLPDGGIDLVFSQVVMNQVDDLDKVYGACSRWVRPGGWMSHHIDFTSLDTTPQWNGHRRYGEFAWRVASGHRPFFVNRAMLSHHLGLMEAGGFEIVKVIRAAAGSVGLAREQLARRWRGCSDDDLTTRSAFVVARRR